ncbi:unnamed protein product [Hyaloperonospora brassicae]|uniref:PDZ domain-containing protein n=1 Tax=Hyaloperonospora brassicae TaxID=162125 RepID=A0AAV0T205_HYABA|nr:unnamed protein product [Hyaloperonospora brassicae]
MAVAPRGATPVPAPSLVAALPTAPSTGDGFYVLVNVVGASLRCSVNPQWPCEALLGAAAEAYRASFVDTEVPECNVVFHRKKQAFLVAGTPICECCASGDELELGATLSAQESASRGAAVPVGVAKDWAVDADGETREFCVLFHKLPLGFTMKRGSDGQTEVGTIYPKSVATHFVRLAPGVAIVSIAGTPLQDMGLRQVHDLIKNATLPLDIRFRGPDRLVSLPMLPDGFDQPVPSPRSPATAVTPPAYSQQEGRRRGGPADCRGIQSNGSDRSQNRHGIRRGNSREVDPIQQQQRLGTQLEGVQRFDALASSSQRTGRESHEAATLVKQIEELKVALLRKHEEAKQIARQLESCSEKLLALRGEANGTAASRQQQQQQQQQQRSTSTKQFDATRSRHVRSASATSGRSNSRLTPEVLEAMDQRAGLPRRGAGVYTSSSISSVSGYSAQSMPVARSATARARTARAAALANADNVSVSSNTSNSSAKSARKGRGDYSPRGTVHRNLTKRYNYMPQRYEAVTASASETGATSLSSRGAVMSRARIPRDSFITKSESPGVGYYDVKVNDRVKGGEIGDSSRSLPWS